MDSEQGEAFQMFLVSINVAVVFFFPLLVGWVVLYVFHVFPFISLSLFLSAGGFIPCFVFVFGLWVLYGTNATIRREALLCRSGRRVFGPSNRPCVCSPCRLPHVRCPVCSLPVYEIIPPKPHAETVRPLFPFPLHHACTSTLFVSLVRPIVVAVRLF